MSTALPRDAKPVPAVAHGYPMLYADLDRLLAASDTGFEAGFVAFVSQLESVFRAEERWMEAAALEACKEHRELHAEILRLLHQAQARSFEGDYALARKVIQLLPAWFDSHNPYMGKPVESASSIARSALRSESAKVHEQDTH